MVCDFKNIKAKSCFKIIRLRLLPATIAEAICIEVNGGRDNKKRYFFEESLKLFSSGNRTVSGREEHWLCSLRNQESLCIIHRTFPLWTQKSKEIINTELILILCCGIFSYHCAYFICYVILKLLTNAKVRVRDEDERKFINTCFSFVYW